MKYLSLGLLSSLLLSACTLTPSPTAEQTLITSATASSEFCDLAVNVDGFLSGHYDYPALFLTIENTSQRVLDFSLAQLQVWVDGRSVAIMPPETMQQERQLRLRRLQRMGAASSTPRHQDQVSLRYGEFVQQQLNDKPLAPGEHLSGYISFDVPETPVGDIRVVFTLDDQEHHLQLASI